MRPYSPQSNLMLNSYRVPTATQSTRSWKQVWQWLKLQQVWQSLVSGILGNEEPHIQRLRDRVGNWYFNVYDPKTRTTSVFHSEREVRIWLDERYYQ